MEAATTTLARSPADATGAGALNRLRSDSRLAERFRDGDDSAFATLYQRHQARVFAVCLGVLGSREDAQDAVQEAFASAANQLRRRAPDELRPWLWRVARNAAIDVARSRPARAGAGTTDTMEELPSPAPGPAHEAEGRSDLRELVGDLADLPENQRSALVMRELGGHSYDEIGGTLGVDEDAVRGLVSRARLSLRSVRASRDLDCEVVREGLAEELDGRRRDATVRRHLRECGGCRDFGSGLRGDARALRGILPAGGLGPLGLFGAFRLFRGAVLGGVLAKGGLSAGGPIAAVCVIGVCAATEVTGLEPLTPMRLPGVDIRAPFDAATGTASSREASSQPSDSSTAPSSDPVSFSDATRRAASRTPAGSVPGVGNLRGHGGRPSDGRPSHGRPSRGHGRGERGGPPPRDGRGGGSGPRGRAAQGGPGPGGGPPPRGRSPGGRRPGPGGSPRHGGPRGGDGGRSGPGPRGERPAGGQPPPGQPQPAAGSGAPSSPPPPESGTQSPPLAEQPPPSEPPPGTPPPPAP